ncbi:MAG: PD40 domain-containing protein [Candidatus Eremiobacteraeota bacterium]|nr:PD40 domain-containing protein [Candidatus Eremiobacteraeota bacterium]
MHHFLTKTVLLVLALTTFCLAGPLSERIVFVAEHNGLKKLYICRPDGRDLERFCREPGHQLQPAYSPTLERMFYVRPVERLHQICSVNSEGRDFRVEVSLRANALYPTVSPDGGKLIFCTDMWGPMELCVMDLESRKIDRITYDGGINTRPRYSPDGNSVLFLSRRNGLTEVYELNLADKALQQLTDSPFAHGAASWSPDGTRFVSTVAKPPKSKSVLIEKDLNSGTLRQLLPDRFGLTSPRYSVDGTQIIFVDDEVLYTFDPSDTKAVLFPLRGQLIPEEVLWIPFPLP